MCTFMKPYVHVLLCLHVYGRRTGLPLHVCDSVYPSGHVHASVAICGRLFRSPKILLSAGLHVHVLRCVLRGPLVWCVRMCGSSVCVARTAACVSVCSDDLLRCLPPRASAAGPLIPFTCLYVVSVWVVSALRLRGRVFTEWALDCVYRPGLAVLVGYNLLLLLLVPSSRTCLLVQQEPAQTDQCFQEVVMTL